MIINYIKCDLLSYCSYSAVLKFSSHLEKYNFDNHPDYEQPNQGN